MAKLERKEIDKTMTKLKRKTLGGSFTVTWYHKEDDKVLEELSDFDNKLTQALNYNPKNK